MDIVNGYPPNIVEIKQYLTPPKWAVFPYNDKIYNPGGHELTPDIIYHEHIHFKQQQEYGTDLWWTKYLTDRDYRLECEREAYGEQYKFLKQAVPDKYLKEYLGEMAEALSTHYGFNITKSQAETIIRKYG